MKALLIVDVQNDFLPGGALAVPKGDTIIPVINAIQEEFDWVIATKDWHLPHHISFASTHNKKPGETINVKGFKQELWPDHCIQNTWGSEFAPQLKTEHIARVFYKGTDPLIDSYSAFFDNANERATGLYEFLKEHHIDEIYIVGLATDYCVKYSALDALKLGLRVHIYLEGCRGIDLMPGDLGKALTEMQRRGALIN